MAVTHLGHDNSNAPADWRAKGKMRARDEGLGQTEGTVLDLKLIGDGFWQAIYTVPLKVGLPSSQRTFEVQVDTGSSDLWIASSSCSTDYCNGAKGHLYDPSGAQNSGQTFSITYLAGSASGPIVWDTVQLGPYSLEQQALASASEVDREPLSSAFNGILGLALQLNSLIARTLPPTLGDTPDGAMLPANIFGTTPASDAPAARFVSLALERPGSDRVKSQLGIGRHPSGIVTDPAKITYSRLVSDSSGSRFWKTSLRGLSVWVNGEERVIEIGRAGTGGVFPSAVLDSGVPLILMKSALANAIYGAIDVGPGLDGQYYLPCTTPLNISLSLGTGPPVVVPLHPLDLSASPPQATSSRANCMGLIQSSDAALTDPHTALGDVILGVPFLRNVYTVMAYAPPDADGSFAGSAATSAASVDPRLGLMAPTDPATAQAEFNIVRVQNQPLPSGSGNSSATADEKAREAGNKGVSIGLKVLGALGGLIALCAFLFLARWWMMRRRLKRERGAGARAAGLDFDGDGAEKAGPGVYGMEDMGASARASNETKGTVWTDEDGTLRSRHDKAKSLETVDELGVRGARAGEADGLETLRVDDPWDPKTAPLLPSSTTDFAPAPETHDQDAIFGGAAGVGAGRGGHRRTQSGSEATLLRHSHSSSRRDSVSLARVVHTRTLSKSSQRSSTSSYHGAGRAPGQGHARHPSNPRSMTPTHAAALAYPKPTPHLGGPALPEERPSVPITTAEIQEAGALGVGLQIGSPVRSRAQGSAESVKYEASYF